MATAMKVLILDPESQRLMDIARVIQAAGHEVMGAASGEEGLRTAKAKQPDLILIDAGLPDISGIDLVKQMKRDPELVDPYVVVVSPEDTAPAIRARALETGADGYLCRGLPRREIAAQVDALLRRKRTERSLQQSLRDWRGAFDSLSDAVYLVDKDHRIVDCNLALAKLLGMAPSEIVGRPCYELIHGTRQPLDPCLHECVRETRRRAETVVPLSERWLEVLVDPLFDAQEQLVGSVHILRDVTQRTKDEEALHDARVELEKRLDEQRAATAKSDEALQAQTTAHGELQQTLDETRAKLEKQAQDHLGVLSRLDGALKGEQDRRKELERALELTGQQLEQEHAALEKSEESRKAENAERQRVVHEMSQLQEVLLSQTAAREQVEAQAEEQRAALAQAQAKIESEVAQRTELEKALSQAQDHLQEQRAALSRGEEALHTVAAQFEQANLQLNETQQALAANQETLSAQTAERQRMEDELSRARTQWEEMAQGYHQALARASEALQTEVAATKRAEEELSAVQKQTEELRAALRQDREALHIEQLERQRVMAEANKLQSQLAHAEQKLQDKLAECKHVSEMLELEVAKRQQSDEALHSAADLVYAWDVDSGNMQFFRDEGARLYANAVEFPKTVHEFQQMIHPDDRQRLTEAMEQHASSEEPFVEEYRVLDGDGRVSYWQSSGALVRDADGKPVRWVGTSTEITARKEAEQAQQERAARLNGQLRMDAVARLAGGLARRFNELLTVIIGSAEVAKAQVEPSYPLHNELENIQKSARQAVGWTRRLLSISGGQVVQRRPLDLNDFLAGRTKMLEHLLGPDVDLQVNRAAKLKDILADADALERVLMSLAAHARRAMPNGGTLRIETEAVTLNEAYCETHPEAQAGEYVRLTMVDSGPALDEEQRAHLFEPFASAAPEEGDGLELAAAYGIVRQHDGWIEVSSLPDGGTRFETYFPAERR